MMVDMPRKRTAGLRSTKNVPKEPGHVELDCMVVSG
jgi:hypothetical protein